MAIVTPPILAALNTAFRAEFQRVFTETPTEYADIATVVPSSTSSNTFGWLGQFPQLRKWVGDRVLKDMAAHGYTITNDLFEGTVSVPRTAIEDDEVGVYKPLVSEMGRAAKAHPDELVFSLLGKGGTTLCYDGQNFFDTDHPVYEKVDGKGADGSGVASVVSNFTAGGGAAWYLLDASRIIKPLIFQERTKPEFTTLTENRDEAVFMQDVYRYGIRYRCNAGFGLWQLAHCSKAALTPANFDAAYLAMRTLKADGGRPLGIKPTVLVVPPALLSAAEEVVKVTRLASGADNPRAGRVQIKECVWLA